MLFEKSKNIQKETRVGRFLNKVFMVGTRTFKNQFFDKNRSTYFVILETFFCFSQTFSRNLTLTYDLSRRSIFYKVSDKRLEKILGEVSQHEPPLTPAQVRWSSISFSKITFCYLKVPPLNWKALKNSFTKLVFWT